MPAQALLEQQRVGVCEAIKRAELDERVQLLQEPGPLHPGLPQEEGGGREEGGGGGGEHQHRVGPWRPRGEARGVAALGIIVKYEDIDARGPRDIREVGGESAPRARGKGRES